jgi:hypothetical protein
MLAYKWDAATEKIVRSDGVKQILGEDEGTHTTGPHMLSMIPPEDRERLTAAVAQLTPRSPIFKSGIAHGSSRLQSDRHIQYCSMYR